MLIDIAYTVLLVAALSVMVAQTLFKQKRIEHIVFAIFCGSLAMVAIQKLSADALGPYQYIIALGTCATCNAMWLVSRAMFRGDNSLSLRHFVFASAIAVLILMNRSIDFLLSLAWVDASAINWIDRSASEITQLMSSTVLALTFWESIRGYAECPPAQKKQRLLFASMFVTAVFTTTVIARGVLPETALPIVYPWLVVCFAFGMMCVTFAILVWQQYERDQASRSEHAELTTSSASAKGNDYPVYSVANPTESEDKTLFTEIEQLMTKDKLYLQAELKIIDIANHLQVSEYRVSRAIRSHSTASNFNHFVNGYRLSHAKQLLTASDSQQWTILVISLESGFASLAPFNRAFKAQEGCTPNQYRHRQAIVAVEQAYL
jgi:AraC-like DNA-binding protein